ncbi:MAG: TlpA family protein disulfide reductase [Nannocystaceae bacterium]
MKHDFWARLNRSSQAYVYALSLIAASLAACTTTTPPRTRPPTAPVPAPDPVSAMPDPAAAPSNREAGEQLAVTIPRIDGDALDLADLRGKVVLVEVSATWVDSWQASYPLYNTLLDEFGDQLAAVLVSVDPKREALSPEPVVRNPDFALGWDPQGALAAQLQLAAFPTILVLDRDGRIAHIQANNRPTATQLRAWIAALLAP